MKKRALLVLLIVSTLVLFGPSTLFAKDIHVLSQFPLSGVLGAYPEIGWGYIDAWNWFNEEKGGVEGQKVIYHLEDFRYVANVEIMNFNKYCSQYSRDELLMATGYITDALKPLIEKVNVEEKIPYASGSMSEELFGKTGGPSKYPYYYSMGVPYGDQIKVLVKWIVDNHKGKGRPKMALINSPRAYGRDGRAEGLAYAKEKGVDIVAQIEYSYSATDASNECMEIRKAKAQYIIYHGYVGAQSATAVFFKTAKKVIPKVQILGTNYMGGRLPFAVNREAYDGMILATCWPPMDAFPRSATSMDNPLVKLLHDLAKKNRPEEYKKGLKGGIRDMVNYFQAALHAFVQQKALLEAHKAGDLSRAGVKKALDNLVWDFHGLYGGKKFSYASHHIPMIRLFRANVKMTPALTGNWTPVSDWINTQEMKW